MDVSEILASHEARQKLNVVEKEIPLVIDAGYLTVTDLNPVDKESYEEDTEAYLLATARDGVQALFSTLSALPTVPSPYGPLTQLPPPTTELPRAKPLPKPKPPTKWEQFAKAKGIQKKRKDRKVWDEEKQEWVNRWGWGGKNKEGEGAWLSEVKQGAEVDHDPAQELRNSRKARVAKNERQQLQNLARAQGSSSQAPEREERKKDIDRTLATTRISTASMGRFDRQLEGEKKLKGVKRKFEPNERSIEEEKKNSLAIISKLENESKRAKKEKSGGDEVLNVRKAIRSASGGKGSAALTRNSSKPKGKKGKR
ncbi:RRS1-domain-containing protein [Gloeophyllum trabeum ATCC 11539]|uniref:Ribosome biogenesis regulatory protein n=1 Tax=Gloeophyllum trabeum (strain ATCC 11539 / FP-39264 / Madison 617) TaxID=670483 RepID=S7QIN7_GLOTA|nr:RRS1-domain-containing protein [Gloeophyllum trabeum ATCC 11539]EPQ59177.1 RRS1-domain-containing protein [Gloeophyllum trabeum ATCC 11539]